MTLQVTGKNVEAGDAFKVYITDKLGDSLEKYIGPEISGHVRLEKERGRFRTDCSIRLKTGLLLESHGEGNDAYASADAAVERMDKRLRRYKRRLKSHHNGHARGQKPDEVQANDYTVRADEDDIDVNEALSEHPVIIAEAERSIKALPVSEAVMQLDVTDRAFLVFRNAGHGGLNVVYRRSDGHIGWIDAKETVLEG
ncbi:MAG: ribosome-associated translation inhibitor RaiA [Hyphomicrobiaceae bacterium]